MKSIQAQLQSRVSLRAAQIRMLHSLQGESNRAMWASIKKGLKRLAEDQALDKRMLYNTYWG
jgi:hypothetical protein